MNDTQWIDITRPLYPGMPVWPGDHETEETPTWRISAGEDCNVSVLTFSSHAGTHVDPPLHFIAGGAPVPDMDVNVLCGPAAVLNLTGLEAHVRPEDLEPAGAAERILLKTRNSFADPATFHRDFLALTEAAAGWMVERGIRLIGVDGPSIEPFGSASYAVHHTILGAGIAVVEGLDLGRVEPGDYELACLPIKWRNGDGAPCRALLRPRGR